jgi:hypothetical protein
VAVDSNGGNGKLEMNMHESNFAISETTMEEGFANGCESDLKVCMSVTNGVWDSICYSLEKALSPEP